MSASHLLVWISELRIIVFYFLFSFILFKMEKQKFVFEFFLDNGEILQTGETERCLDLAQKCFSVDT